MGPTSEVELKSNGLMTSLPRHTTNEAVNEILFNTESAIQRIHLEYEQSSCGSSSSSSSNSNSNSNDKVDTTLINDSKTEDSASFLKDGVYANSYVDLGRVDTVGFDYDYTLVTYTSDLQELIYDMALKRTVLQLQHLLKYLQVRLTQRF